MDGTAAAACGRMGAKAFTLGRHIGFAGTPDLHTTAHEAAHFIQQRAGVRLKTGVGRPGDPFERHADAVADRVVRGESSEGLLDAYAGAGPSASGPDVVQQKIEVKAWPRSTSPDPQDQQREDAAAQEQFDGMIGVAVKQSPRALHLVSYVSGHDSTITVLLGKGLLNTFFDKFELDSKQHITGPAITFDPTKEALQYHPIWLGLIHELGHAWQYLTASEEYLTLASNYDDEQEQRARQGVIEFSNMAFNESVVARESGARQRISYLGTSSETSKRQAEFAAWQQAVIGYVLQLDEKKLKNTDATVNHLVECNLVPDKMFAKRILTDLSFVYSLDDKSKNKEEIQKAAKEILQKQLHAFLKWNWTKDQ